MISPGQIDQLLYLLAAHPVLPAMDLLPSPDEALHALLAEVAAGERSAYAEHVSRVANETGITPAELARRAEFLLACLILPQSGNYYELLGVSPQATPEDIRRRWITLIQRYHPDHLSPNTSWMAEQARRLIEAYETLRDAEKRRSYDAALRREPVAVTEMRRDTSARHSTRTARPMRRRWMAVIVLMLSLGGLTWVYLRSKPTPLPRVALPAAPKLLEAWPLPAHLTPVRWSSSPSPTPAVENIAAPEPSSAELSEQSRESGGEPERPTARHSVTDNAQELPTQPVMRHQPSKPGAIAKETRAMAVPDVLSSNPTSVRRSPSQPRPAVSAPLPAAESALFPKVGRAAMESQEPPPVGPPAATATVIAVPPVTPTIAFIPPMTVVNLEAEKTPSRVASAEDDPLRLIEAFRTAYEREDLNTLMRLFSAAPREREAVGWEAVQGLYARNFAALDQIHYELTRLESPAPAANNALVVHGWFRIRAVRRESPSRPVEATGPVHWLLRREPKALRIAEIHYELSER